MKKAIILSQADNVATALMDIAAGEQTEISDKNGGIEKMVISKEKICRGHKIAVENIDQGNNVTKYGYTIGIASKAIQTGEFVHVHNLESSRGRGDLA